MLYYDIAYDIEENKINKVYIRNAADKGEYDEILDCTEYELSFKKLIETIYTYFDEHSIEWRKYGAMILFYKDESINNLNDINTTDFNTVSKVFRIITLDTSNYLPENPSMLWVIPYPYTPPKRNSDDPDIINVNFTQE